LQSHETSFLEADFLKLDYRVSPALNE